MPRNAPYVIITPYYKEDRRLIERCIASVRSQTRRTDHILVADGFPQDWIDTVGVRHLKLDRSHGDNGNTPRSIGALLAVAEQYAAIGLLDVDNWFTPDHVEACVAAASRASLCDFVITQRTFHRLDESVMPLDEEPDHVDTSCLFFLPGAFSVLPHWGMMPKRLSPVCDRVFFSMLCSRGLVAARVEKPTVRFQTLYAGHYLAIGETPPPDAKPDFDLDAIEARERSLLPREQEIARRLIGGRGMADGRRHTGVFRRCTASRQWNQPHEDRAQRSMSLRIATQVQALLRRHRLTARRTGICRGLEMSALHLRHSEFHADGARYWSMAKIESAFRMASDTTPTQKNSVHLFTAAAKAMPIV